MCFLFVMAAHVVGQGVLVPGVPTTETFEVMGETSDAALPEGWVASPPGQSHPVYANEDNLVAVNRQASSGAPVAGGFYNWGDTLGHRSPGFMSSGTYPSPNHLMVAYRNDSQATFFAVDLSFRYKRFRRNTSPASITFFTSMNGEDWVAVEAGDSGPLTTGDSTYGFPESYQERTVRLDGLTVEPGRKLYLRWTFDTTGAHSQGVALDDVELQVVTWLKPEPSFHATDVQMQSVTHRTLVLTWQDAQDGILPDGYLLIGSRLGFDAMPSPIDGVNLANQTDWENGLYVNKIDQGVQGLTLTRLEPRQTYSFRLYPFSNRLGLIDYKTDGSVPSLIAVTAMAPFEDMEDVSQTAYTTNAVALKSGTWFFNNALLGQTANDQRRDQRSVRLQGNGSLDMMFDLWGVTSFGFEHANFGNDIQGACVLEQSRDGGSTWQQIGETIHNGDTLEFWQTDIPYGGKSRFRIRQISGVRINIDNIRITRKHRQPTRIGFR